MSGTEAALWGGVGGIVMSLIDAIVYLRTVKFVFPSVSGRQVCGYVIAQLLLVVLGALAAFLLSKGSQIDGLMGAVASGVGAPETFKKLAGLGRGA